MNRKPSPFPFWWWPGLDRPIRLSAARLLVVSYPTHLVLETWVVDSLETSARHSRFGKHVNNLTVRQTFKQGIAQRPNTPFPQGRQVGETCTPDRANLLLPQPLQAFPSQRLKMGQEHRQEGEAVVTPRVTCGWQAWAGGLNPLSQVDRAHAWQPLWKQGGRRWGWAGGGVQGWKQAAPDTASGCLLPVSSPLPGPRGCQTYLLCPKQGAVRQCACNKLCCGWAGMP